jgi:hypothetical protein
LLLLVTSERDLGDENDGGLGRVGGLQEVGRYVQLVEWRREIGAAAVEKWILGRIEGR